MSLANQTRREYLEFHNPTDKETKSTLLLDLKDLPKEISISFRLSSMSNIETITSSMEGIREIYDADTSEPLPDIEGIIFNDKIYEAVSSAIVRINGIHLSSFEFGAILIYIRNMGGLPRGMEYTFEVRQEVDEQVVGGSTYVISIEDNIEIGENISPYADFNEGPEEGRYLYPWLRDDVEGLREGEQQLMHDFLYVTKLTGKEEVPAVETSIATGSCQFQQAKEDKKQLWYYIYVTNIRSVTSVSVHNGKEGANGEVIVPLFKSDTVRQDKEKEFVIKGVITSNSLRGSLAGKELSYLSDLMKNGYTYVNIFTEQNPNGEIRGQIYPYGTSKKNE